ncbi:phage major capsid protein [Shimia sagamensis]|uniref:Phage major capsid protein, HK97 family n=1 Tax=Shimia sagamensis TaxID=1566352 RepID=A0ABY1PIV7_9RHOB|nr:phage major capsid protein [Shimia sagamensis]SMP35330.1 phage major capsid protein, HK97 family [Shimia sagamensis]
MPKDTPLVSGDLRSEKMESQARKALQQRAYEVAFEAAAEDVNAAPQLAKTVARLEGEIEGMKAEAAKPVNVTVKAPAKPKSGTGQVQIRGLRMAAVRFAIGAIQHQTKRDPRAIAADLLGKGDQYQQAIRSATTPATTTAAGWAAELVRSDVREFYRDMEQASVFAQLVARAGLTIFDGANSVTWPMRADAQRGSMRPAWIQENATIPVVETRLASTTMNRFKLGAITTASNELLRTSNPDLLPLLEGFIRQDMSEALDADLLDPANPIQPTIRPASITNAAPNKASAGNNLASIVTDFKWLLGQASALRMIDPVVILHSDRVVGLQMVQGTGGTEQFPLRDEVAGGSLFGLPLIHSPYAPAGQAVITDAHAFKCVADPVEVDTSSAVTLAMASADGVIPAMSTQPEPPHPADEVGNDGSIHISDAASTLPPTEVRSMFQTNSTALRLIAPLSWTQMKPATSYLTGVTW